MDDEDSRRHSGERVTIDRHRLNWYDKISTHESGNKSTLDLSQAAGRNTDRGLGLQPKALNLSQAKLIKKLNRKFYKPATGKIQWILLIP